ncbi:hypothetical protein [Deinococcus marmoris]|uniref:Uncharacterized protein n=1 Tax=Deinococcus marmoris TaxID=249408 RepID=A0A1U7NR12_9DEIO|nr:hypothetical protein [Deinococcus marmoris]OLV15363.1 hypothetical protein BOO71_0015145 [Deinococcus marmoris]
MHKNLIWTNDPGHAWLAVPRTDLRALGIEARITGYSYVRGDTVYLEEDLDAGTYLEAAKGAGWTVETTEENVNWTPIRGYASYQV